MNEKDPEGFRPIDRACLAGDAERVRRLIEEGADLGRFSSSRKNQEKKEIFWDSPLTLVCRNF